MPYEVNVGLWADGADKRHWIALPDGSTIDIAADGDLLFPTGTVLLKEFAADGAPVETRMLVHHADGYWAGYSYQWEADLSDAVLLSAGQRVVLDSGLEWTFPSRPQCLQCHTQAANFSLGPEVAQLNDALTYPSSGIRASQLRTLAHIGLFSSALSDDPHDLPSLPAGNASVVPGARLSARKLQHLSPPRQQRIDDAGFALRYAG